MKNVALRRAGVVYDPCVMRTTGRPGRLLLLLPKTRQIYTLFRENDLFVDLRQDFRVFEKVVFLDKQSSVPVETALNASGYNELLSCHPKYRQLIAISSQPETAQPLTSSPTLIGFPPQPGNNTRSPGCTETEATTPSLFGAPGPTAMTVASGKGEEVADEGRKIPVEVF